MANAMSGGVASATRIFDLHYLSLRNVISPEDQSEGRKRYCGIVKADRILNLNAEENVRSFLGLNEDGKKRKPTFVNKAILETLKTSREKFPLLNTGLVIVARTAEVDDAKHIVRLTDASIINGAQTQGVLKVYFSEHPEDKEFPSLNVELIVTDKEDLIAEISIARNFQNEVKDLSIYGREKRFDSLEAAMQGHQTEIRLRKSETDYGDDYLDTEKLIQVLTVLIPSNVAHPGNRGAKEGVDGSRVYAYSQRARCLQHFAEVMDSHEDPNADEKWEDAYQLFHEICWDAWSVYKRLKAQQTFSRLKKVEKEEIGGKLLVAEDGVPDGIVFPILAALSKFVVCKHGKWIFEIPKEFPMDGLCEQAKAVFTTIGKHNPQTMGKSRDCYVSLDGLVNMFLLMSKSKK
jgi:hypothetical protein